MADSTITQLTELFKDASPDAEDLRPLLEEVAGRSQTHFIVIDAIDECVQAERGILFRILQGVADSKRTRLKIFIASRPDIGPEIKRMFKFYRHISMNSSGLHSDIATYVKDVLIEKNESGDLKVGRPALIHEIEDALVKGAQGMLVHHQYELHDRH